MHYLDFRAGPAVSAALLACFAALLPLTTGAHAERQSFFPNGDWDGPSRHELPVYRPPSSAQTAERLVVCKRAGDMDTPIGADSAARIAAMPAGVLKAFNEELLAECVGAPDEDGVRAGSGFAHLQAAVDAVTLRRTNIYVLPGIYREEPSVRALNQRAGASTPGDMAFCQAVLQSGVARLSYEQQYRCRHIHNTVAIFGDPDFTDDNCGDDIEGVCTNPDTQKCLSGACQYYDLQVEGTGEKITDVIFEGDFTDGGQFRYLNGIRGDRADGLYLRNFTTQIYEFNAVYVLETDGFVLDRLIGRWVDEYSFLSFAADHGLYESSGGYGAADSVLYPGSGADIYKNAMHSNANLRQRQGTEIRNSWATHAAGGYSGTAGNSPWVHNNIFYKNQLGLATESVFGGHPGMPQDHGLFENNLAYNNNKFYFRFVEEDGPCIAQTPRDRGVVPPEFREFDSYPPEVQEAILDRMVLCPGIPFPTGTGMVIGGGNYDVNSTNIVFDNWKIGYQLFHVPAVIRHTSEEDPPTNTDPLNPFDNSHFNRFDNNRFGQNPLTNPVRRQPNGVDFWFDNSGVGNCWVNNQGWDGSAFTAAAVTQDTGDPLQSLPSNCTDGPLPNLAEQIATENPIRIAFLASCVLYDRNDPSTKSPLCPFFDVPVAPPGRQGSPEVIVSQPPQAITTSGNTVKAGYFVLNNDTGDTHVVSSVTVAAAGGFTDLSSLTLKVITQTDTERKTTTATVNSVGGSNVFTFSDPVQMDPVNYVLFDLEVTAADDMTAALNDAQKVLLASGAGTALFGMVLMMGGLRRRYLWLLVLLPLCAGMLISCNGSSSGNAGGGGGGGGGGSTTSFSLTGLSVATSGGTPVTYTGLPLAMGRVTVQP